MNFFDAHCHQLLNQDGGLLIGLEGKPAFSKALTNAEAIALEDSNRLLFAVEYVTLEAGVGSRPCLKYHPRREGYSPSWVQESLTASQPKLCVIDTLNQPHWQPMDYWTIARTFPSIPFIFCHAGGYDILEFLKMADFTPNIWLDFSLTQEYFGWTGRRPRLPHVTDCIDHALSAERFRRKVLFGSDEAFFSQLDPYQKYLELPHAAAFLEENYLRLIEAAGIA